MFSSFTLDAEITFLEKVINVVGFRKGTVEINNVGALIMVMRITAQKIAA